eukprot:jgi/Undpi1/10057/HiC_scaffold_28.g12511.m1
MHRVAALERDVVKIEGLWDKDKGQRVIEVWMSLLKKTSYKPSKWRSYSPRVCAAMTLQNWWRSMLVIKLGWSSSEGSASAASSSRSASNDDKGNSDPEKDAAKAGSFVQSTGDAAAGGPSSNTGKSLPTGMKEKLGFRQEEPSNQHLGSERGSMDSVDARQSKSMSDVDPEAVAVIEAEDSPQDRAPSAEEPPNQPWIIKGGGNGGVLTDRELSPPNAEAAFHLRKAGGKGNNDIISTQQDRLPPAQDGGGVAKADLIADVVKGDEGEQKHDRHAEAPVVGSTTAAVTVNAGSRGEGTLLTAVPAGDDLGKGGKRHGSGHHHHRHHTEGHTHPLQSLHHASGGSSTSVEGGGSSVQGMFEGALGQSPILMMTSMAMQLQSLETEIDNLRQKVEGIELFLDGQSRSKHHIDDPTASERGKVQYIPCVRDQLFCKVPAEDFVEMGRHLGQLQRELHGMQKREEDRDRRTDLSLEAIEALVSARDEDSDRRFQEQAQENADRISKLLEQLDAQGLQEKSDVVRKPLQDLKVELRSLCLSLAAISANETTSWRGWGVSGYTNREEQGLYGGGRRNYRDKARLEPYGTKTGCERFADMATDLGTTLFAFIKAQVLQTRRARDGRFSDITPHRRCSNPDDATAVITANLTGSNSAGGGGGGGGGGDGGTTATASDTAAAAAADRESDGGRAGTSASPQAWAKLGYLTYTRDLTGEVLPFPAGMVVLLKAISYVLNHCVGTGDLAVRHGTRVTENRGGGEDDWQLPGLRREGFVVRRIRLSVTLEDLTLYVAQRTDTEKESVLRQLSAPIDGVRAKLGGMESTLAGFQRTMHLVLGEVDADRERAAAIEALGYTVQNMQGLFSRVSDELKTKAGALEIEEALQEMTAKIQGSVDEQSRLQRLARTLGRDHNSTTAMKRLQVELEQARATAVIALAQRDTDVLIGSRCLSCNRPLGGFMPPQLPNNDRTAWAASAGGSRGQRDRFLEATMTVGAGSITGNSGGGGGGGTSSMEGSSIVGSIGNVGSNGVGENVGMPRKSSSHTQLAMMDGNMFSPVSDFSGTAPGTAPRTAPKKALNGPILFERTREADGEPSPSVLRGRVLRPGVSPTPNEGNVSVSKPGDSSDKLQAPRMSRRASQERNVEQLSPFLSAEIRCHVAPSFVRISAPSLTDDKIYQAKGFPPPPLRADTVSPGA